MQVGEIQKVSSRDLEAKMCVYHVPDGWGRARVLNYGIPKYYRTIFGYLPEHEFQEIDFLPGHSALGEWYYFSDVGEAAQGLGLSHLFPCDTVSEEWTRFCLQFWKLFRGSFFESLHCLGARGGEAMAVVVYRVYERIEPERRKMFGV